MWLSSICPPNLSLIGPLTREICYLTGITGNTDRHTYTQAHIQTESDTLPIIIGYRVQ